MQTFKEAMKRADPRESLSTRVSRFLFKYRRTPHSTTGISPAELLLGCRPHSHFDFMLPNLASKIRSKQLAQKVQHDKKSKPRTLKIGSNVLVHNFSTGPEWLFGTIVNTKGPLSYIVKLSDGRYFKRHIDHLRKTDITDHYATVPDVNDDYSISITHYCTKSQFITTYTITSIYQSQNCSRLIDLPSQVICSILNGKECDRLR